MEIAACRNDLQPSHSPLPSPAASANSVQCQVTQLPPMRQLRPPQRPNVDSKGLLAGRLPLYSALEVMVMAVTTACLARRRQPVLRGTIATNIALPNRLSTATVTVSMAEGAQIHPLIRTVLPSALLVRKHGQAVRGTSLVKVHAPQAKSQSPRVDQRLLELCDRVQQGHPSPSAQHQARYDFRFNRLQH